MTAPASARLAAAAVLRCRTQNAEPKRGPDDFEETFPRRSERDILVASNEYAYVQDLTKGDIVLYVGPTKISLSNTERLVELKNDRFLPVRGEEGTGVLAFVTASSAQYVASSTRSVRLGSISLARATVMNPSGAP